MKSEKFSAAYLAGYLRQLSLPQNFLLAYSGGMDSHVLLHALSCITAPGWSVAAVHINHGLHPAAGDWAQHCRQTCERLQVPITVIDIDASPRAGESPEACARIARYTALGAHLAPGQVLLTAHHLDDQAETCLLQLLRGSGVRGLAAMPARQTFAKGEMVRPLLEINREELLVYARSEQLNWVEDNSNQDVQFDRNYLRQQVMPVLQARWPAANRSFSQSSRHAAEASELLDELAAGDLQRGQHSTDQLDLRILSGLPALRSSNVLRYWLHSANVRPPGRKRLQEFVRQLQQANVDRTPRLVWDDVELCCYQHTLYLLKALPYRLSTDTLQCNIKAMPELPYGQLRLEHAVGTGLAYHYLQDNNLRIRFRHGGEKIQLAGHAEHKTLKNILQEHKLPPWLRDFLPLIYYDNILVMIPGIGTVEGYQARADEPGVSFNWDWSFQH
ncbi:MAG: tRNA lysidine(34) synthetase TilS [Gammaproteobacteria bacterium]